MSKTHADDRIFSILALGLLITGLLGPFIIAAFSNDDLAIGFGVIATLLALLFGILGWKQRMAKVAVITIGFLIVASLTALLLFFPKRAQAEEHEREAQSEAIEDRRTR